MVRMGNVPALGGVQGDAILFVTLREDGFLKKIPSSRWAVWTGSSSYGLYLWHFPVYRAMVVSGFGSEIEGLTVGIVITFILAALPRRWGGKVILAVEGQLRMSGIR